MKDKEREMLLAILHKQADFVGCPKSFFTPFAKGKKMPAGWYKEYEWTHETEAKFCSWLKEYVVKKRIERNKRRAKMFVAEWSLCYGWRNGKKDGKA